jgi:hypothetical protein
LTGTSREPPASDSGERRQGGADALRAPFPGAPARITDTLDHLLHGLGVAPKPTAERVFAAFKGAAGDDLARVAMPTRFERGELLVDVASAAHTQELNQFTGEALRDRLNAALGSPLVRQIRFRHRVAR